MESRLQASSNSPTLIDIEEGRVDIAERPSAGEQCCHYFRSFVQFLFSYVGLTAMLCAYLLLGAIVFRHIELGNEEKLRREIRDEMENVFGDLFQEARTKNVMNWTSKVITMLSEKQKNYTSKSIVFMEYLDGGEKWSFFGSMLFSLTVLSTIEKNYVLISKWNHRGTGGSVWLPIDSKGYGHVAPLTIIGKLFCMFYALIGIPLMLLVLTNVGRVMATSARLLYRMYTSRLCKRCRCGKRSKAKKKKKRKKQAKKTLQRKGSTKSAKGPPNKKRTRKGSKRRKSGQPTRQTIVSMDQQTKLTNQRPLSLNMDLVSSSDPRLPPPYAESNEMAERLAEGNEEEEEIFSDTHSSRRSLGSTPCQQSLINLPRPVSAVSGEGSVDDAHSEVASLCTPSDMDRRSPSLTKSDSYDSASSQPFPTSSRAESNVELSGGKQTRSSFPRQQSCIEFRQLDKGGDGEERKEGDGSEGDSSRTSSEPKSISRQSSSASRYSPSGSQTYPRAEKRRKRRRDYAHSDGSASIDRSTLGVNHRHGNTFPRRRRARKKVLMKPPSLYSLHHHRKLKLIDSTLAIRLATYDKILGSSREDLAFALPELSCGENTKLLHDIANKGFDPRPPPPLPDIEQGREGGRKGKGKRKKKGRRGEALDDELGTIYEGSESDTSETRGARNLEVADIPMWPVLLLLFSYITSGAILFSMLETNWNFFDAFYFCFITLTTIGFGDLVPDTKLSSLIACCVYTMIGMAVTSMCIALIMKKFIFIVKNFGRRIGIIKD